jgi:hypothetical protein
MPDDTGKKQKPQLFKPGQSGNPAGRPKGARSKLGEEFLKALLADFEKHGVVAVESVRTDKPDQYLKVIASILPKEITGEDGAPLEVITRIELVGVSPSGYGAT